MKYIKLSRGKRAIVDDDDYEWLNQYRWYCHVTGYAQTNFPEQDGYRSVKMHRLILDAPEGLEVDHINHNRLDNRRENIRLCTRSENQRNQSIRVNSVSGYRGVTLHAGTKKWRARIWVGKTNKSLGLYDDPKEAAIAYDKAAKKIYGEFAGLNFKESLA